MERPLTQPDDRLGRVIGGKYRLDRVLGSGAMGTVYAAVHQWTNREVAVKLLHEQAVEDAMTRQRFLREAQVAAGLEHPNVVDVLDMGEEDGKVYLVLEMLVGESLEARREREGKLAPAEVLGIALPLLDALGRAHEMGIVHRDIKPENVILHERDGTIVPKLLDFGIAKRLDPGDGLQTAVGTVLGTPQYMSPEQAAAETRLSPASDIWSMGVVLFECLTGKLPFQAKTRAATMLAIVSTDAPSCASVDPSVPAELAKAVDRALRNKAAERYGSTVEFADALRAAAAKAGITPRLPRAPGDGGASLAPPGDAAAARPWVGIALAVVLGLGALWALLSD